MERDPETPAPDAEAPEASLEVELADEQLDQVAGGMSMPGGSQATNQVGHVGS
jgi:hypothetical protein